jgi:hypothetical protein
LNPGTNFRAIRHMETHGLSLISFHRILIAVAILFCAGYGVYELSEFSRNGETGSLLISGFFFVVMAGLTYYLRYLKRFLGVED